MSSRYLDISPASVAQVQRAFGTMVQVDDDVQNVARDLRAIDPGLSLFYDASEDVWIVMQVRDGVEHLVTTAQECDQRIVHRVREVSSERYDLVAELEASDAQIEKDKDAALHEQTGDVGERLLHAMRHDKGEKAVSVRMPRGVDG